MGRLGFADQQQLSRWADTIAARSEFPRLIRRLVLETGKAVVNLGFPAGEGVATGSWDGTVRATESHPFVPAGLSLWELSVERSVGAKADRDYSKREQTPDSSPTSECTYIAASLRRWAKRVEWATERSSQGRWKEVRAYGVDDIETWLEDAPVTHAWISEQLGLSPYGLVSAETWWSTWQEATTPQVSAQLVLAGRDSATEALRQRLGTHPQLTTIKAGSLEEALAFIAAVVHKAASEGDGQLLARTVFVDDIETWRSLAQQSRPLILVPLVEALVQESARTTGHFVVVPLPGGSDADIGLPPIGATAAREALKQAGMDDDDRQADEAGKLARRSLLALRRRLANKPELHQPDWASRPANRLTRGLLLAGQWNEQIEGDKAAVEALSGAAYDQLREELVPLRAGGDPFLAAIGSSWSLVSAYDAWLLLRDEIREDDLERLQPVIETVFLERNPALELDPQDQWRASLAGKVRTHSAELRSGLAETLALLGIHGDRINVGDAGTGAMFASRSVAKLLEKANDDQAGDLWASLSDVLPLMGEAAPSAFLEAVRAGTQGTDPILRTQFVENSDGLFGPMSPHTGLLWALEGVAWSPEHFGQAVMLLAQLAEIDPHPNSRHVNRPFNSLTDIFCPWYPDNSVDVDGRLEAIDALRGRYPEVAWRLILRLLPDDHGIHTPTHEPMFRDWKPPRRSVSTLEYVGFIRAIVGRLLEDAGSSAGRWSALVKESLSSPPDDRAAVRRALTERIGADQIEPEGRQALWDMLRSVIGQHRKYPEADWALPSDEIDALQELEKRLAPAPAFDRLSWLFTEHAPSLGEERGSYERYTAALNESRSDAIGEIEKEDGFVGVRRVASDSVVPGAVGYALANSLGSKYEDDMLPSLGSDDGSELVLATGYFGRRFEVEGWAWLLTLLDQELNAQQAARLLLGTYDFPRAWEVAKEQGSKVENQFWQHFQPYGLGADFAYLTFAVGKLIEANRLAVALDLAQMYLRNDNIESDGLPQLVATALEGILKLDAEDDQVQALSQSDLNEVFSYLEQHRDALGEDRLARLEWAYLPALGFHPKVDALHDLLAQDPEFFVQVVSTVFKARSKETPEEEKTPERARMATNGYRLLSSWRNVPGASDDGRIDGSALKAWVGKALELLEAADRKEIGEDQIGRVLASCGADKGDDGGWPCVEVRDLLEELQSKRVEDGFRVEVFNRRGTTSRLPGDGGNQERALVDKYRASADQFANRWPRTAAILRGLATTYEHDARREDSSAERFRQGFER